MKSTLAAVLCSGLCLAQNGERLFQGNCALCHGPRGDGGKGTNLAQPRLPRAPDDEALFRVIRQGIPGTEMPGTRHFSDDDIREVISFVRSLGQTTPPKVEGDAAHGAELYRGKGNCAACHTMGGRGGAMGPDLTEIGVRRSPGHIRTSIVDPEAWVPDNFLNYRWYSLIPDNFVQVRLVARGGQRLTGVRINEDPFSIQIRDAGDRVHSFWKTELAELHKDWGKSPMPSYRGVLTPGEIDDLVAYLVTLRGGS